MKGSDAVRAVEHAYAAVWRRHRELPPPEDVLCLVELPTPNAAWVQEPQRRGDQYVLGMAVDTLKDPVHAMAVVLHEATHMLAAVRKVRDVRADNRYHTVEFRDLSNELGLITLRSIQPSHGWAVSTIPRHTTHRYRASIARFDALER